MSKTYIQFFRLNTLGSSVEFKHITAFNLIILEKDYIVCVSLDNTIICLNLIGNLMYLSFTQNTYSDFKITFRRNRRGNFGLAWCHLL